MRVITGSAKGRKLQMVPGDSTRPITDRAKEALFSILGTWIDGARVLDLFGGTGAVGIECLSRGAAFAHFLDLNRKAVDTIRINLRNCQLEKRAVVERGDSFQFLQNYHGDPFDLIYVAPPQYQGLWHKALLLIDKHPELLEPDCEVIVQIHPREERDVELDLTTLYEYDRRKYGSVLLLFYGQRDEIIEPGEHPDGDTHNGDTHDDDTHDGDEEDE